MPPRKPPRDDPKQSERFIKTARELEADESGEAFERAFKKVTHRPDASSPCDDRDDEKR